jgi:pimeloyl-ACP methyl ester carboxylesterase
MDTVIIGIHGLRNKPPKYILSSWWKKSIIEGFQAIRLPVPSFKFEMAYWASYLYTKPQNPLSKDPADPQHLLDPYVPGCYFGPRAQEPFGKKLTQTLKEQLVKLVAGQSGFMNIEAISHVILHRMFEELDIYYHKPLRTTSGAMQPAKNLFRAELEHLIYKYRKKNIIILAHSMGAIIAYDVLLHLKPEIRVHSLITFGAPLGFPVIMKKIKQELNLETTEQTLLPTPACLQYHWLNFSDPEDITCLDYNLRNYYSENSSGVRPFDQIVYNNYECNNEKNPHKAYGYLRTAELTQAIYNILNLENASLWQRIKWVFRRPQILTGLGRKLTRK